MSQGLQIFPLIRNESNLFGLYLEKLFPQFLFLVPLLAALTAVSSTSNSIDTIPALLLTEKLFLQVLSWIFSLCTDSPSRRKYFCVRSTNP